MLKHLADASCWLLSTCVCLLAAGCCYSYYCCCVYRYLLCGPVQPSVGRDGCEKNFYFLNFNTPFVFYRATGSAGVFFFFFLSRYLNLFYFIFFKNIVPINTLNFSNETWMFARVKLKVSFFIEFNLFFPNASVKIIFVNSRPNFVFYTFSCVKNY